MNYLLAFTRLSWGSVVYERQPTDGTTYSVEISNVFSTNSQYIVGEKGPWISSVTTTIVPTDATFTYRKYLIKGERLACGNVYVNNVKLATGSYSCLEGLTISFDTDLPAGSYPVYVQNAIGKSNTVFVTIGASSQPSILVSWPNGGQVFNPGQQALVHYSISNFPRPINVQIQLNKGAIYPNGPYNPVGKATAYLPATGNYTFTIPTNAVPGNDYSFMINSDYPSTEVSAHFQSDNFTVATIATTTQSTTPVINSASYSGDKGQLTITGERLNSTNLYLDGVWLSDATKIVSWTSSQIVIKASNSTRSVYVQSSKLGKSNTVQVTTAPTPVPSITGVNINLPFCTIDGGRGLCEWQAGVTKTVRWAYQGFPVGSNNTVSLYFCHPTTDVCTLGSNSIGLTDKLPSGSVSSGTGTFVIPIGAKILENASMAPYISNSQSRIKICATNGTCAYSSVFKITRPTATSIKKLNQLANALQALQKLVDSYR